MRKGLMNPKNYQEDTGGSKFKEGLLKVDSSVFVVHCDQAPKNPRPDQKEPVPLFAHLLKCTRLNEEMEPLEDHEGNVLTENIVLKWGATSLVSVHPANGDNPDDEEVEDQGTEVGVSGNTLVVINQDFKLHPKTGAAIFYGSLIEKGFKEDVIDRGWADDFTGTVFDVCLNTDPALGEMEQTAKDGTKSNKVTPYKIVRKLVRAPYEGGGTTKKGAGKAAAAEKTEKAAKGAKVDENAEVLALLDPILTACSEKLDGKITSRKLFIKEYITPKLTDAKTHLPVMKLLKDDGWLTAPKTVAMMKDKWDMTFNGEDLSFTFGEAA